jgi:hypothetical protein
MRYVDIWLSASVLDELEHKEEEVKPEAHQKGT